MYVKNLSDYYVSSAREVYEIMRQGGAARVVTSTSKRLRHRYVQLKVTRDGRHERGIFAVAFYFSYHNSATQYRNGGPEEREPVPR